MAFFKLVIIGDDAVGKTWLIHRCMHKDDVNFPNTRTTNGASLNAFSIKGKDCKRYKLCIWELTGVYGYSRLYFGNALGFLILFDVTSEITFTNAIGKWMDCISSHAPVNIPVILVGTECDLNEERVISQDRIHTVCDEMNLLYIEVSAKEGINVEFTFKEILEEMICFKKLNPTQY